MTNEITGLAGDPAIMRCAASYLDAKRQSLPDTPLDAIAYETTIACLVNGASEIERLRRELAARTTGALTHD
jgi:hypothetical protein